MTTRPVPRNGSAKRKPDTHKHVSKPNMSTLQALTNKKLTILPAQGHNTAMFLGSPSSGSKQPRSPPSPHHHRCQCPARTSSTSPAPVLGPHSASGRQNSSKGMHGVRNPAASSARPASLPVECVCKGSSTPGSASAAAAARMEIWVLQTHPNGRQGRRRRGQGNGAPFPLTSRSPSSRTLPTRARSEQQLQTQLDTTSHPKVTRSRAAALQGR